MRTIITVGGAHIESFDSFLDFVQFAQDNPNPLESQSSSAGWAGSASLEDAVNIAKHGYMEVRPQVDALFDDISERIADRLDMRFQTTLNYTGAVVDMGRFVLGDPECMLDYVPETADTMNRVVRILVNISASSGVSADEIRRRGVAVAALVDTLHKMGMGMELWVEDALKAGVNYGSRFATRCKIHDSSQMMDIDSLMFALAHPSMLRRLVFSVQEQSPKAREQGAYSGGGYGRPNELHSHDLDADVKIERLQSGEGDIIKDPVGWVLSTVSGLGIE